MNKIPLLFVIIAVGAYFIYGLVTVISSVKNYGIGDFLIVITLLILILLLEVFLIRKYKKSNEKEIYVEQSIDDSINVKETDVPIETLEQMRKYYTTVQLQDDLRILQESIDLMKSTNNIETFISRSDLAQRTSLTIEQAIMAGIHVKEIFTSSKDILSLKTALLPKLLDDSYSKMKKDAFKLKTEKGRIGRFQKYLELLEKHEYDLDISENYENIIHVVRQEINQLSHSYK
ncbi:hypothetical protein [Lysinibacillus sphaericus]|uniref:hypothetical protein n=1 Tax=Lysinibacillus sphaericus TaxID=1421 RepID=UPI003D7F69F6